ncbi:hypothetical protein ACWIEX_12770 [Bosea sp. NPDC055353]
MESFRRAAVSASCLVNLVVPVGTVDAHPTGLSLSAQEITTAISGKVCSTGGGAKFAFGNDGRFNYDGLWQSSGSYIVTSNAIVVTFDSGLRRAFLISIRDGSLYMEKTRVSCAASG